MWTQGKTILQCWAIAHLYVSGGGLVEERERERKLEGGSPPSFDRHSVITPCQALLWGGVPGQDGPDQAAAPTSVHPGGVQAQSWLLLEAR